MSRWNFLRNAATAENSGTQASATPIANAADWRVSTNIRENQRVTDLKIYGFQAAGESRASHEVLKTVIGWLYHNRITVEGMHAQDEDGRIAELREREAEAEAALAKARHRKTTSDEQLAVERERLSARKAELAAIRAGESGSVHGAGLGDRITTVISGLILVVLTLYLFLFYVSAIYNAFILDPTKMAETGLRTGRELSVTIFNGLAFQNAWSSGLFTFLFIGSAPSIVIGLGFLIHHFKKLNRWVPIVVIAGVTLLFDVLLAYEIVYQIHRLKELTGEASEAWSLGVLVQSAEFYIILLAGFVVYLIWGLILDVFLEGIEKMQPTRVAARQVLSAIAEHEARCTRLETEGREAAGEVVAHESDLKTIRMKQSPRELRKNEFGRHVEEFMHGWLQYISQAFPNEHTIMEHDAQQVRTDTVAGLLR